MSDETTAPVQDATTEPALAIPSTAEIRSYITSLQSQLDGKVTAVREKIAKLCEASDAEFNAAKVAAKKAIRENHNGEIASLRKNFKAAVRTWEKLAESQSLTEDKPLESVQSVAPDASTEVYENVDAPESAPVEATA